MKNLLFFIMLLPSILLAQGGPYMCGDWYPPDQCEPDGRPNEAAKNSYFANGFQLIASPVTFDYTKLSGGFLLKHVTHIFSNHDLGNPQNVYLECDQFCPMVENCGDPDIWDKGEDGTCYKHEMGPYDCNSPTHPWVSTDWGSGPFCEPYAGGPQQAAIEHIGRHGLVYDGLADSYSYVTELPHEKPPTSYKMLVERYQFYYFDSPENKHDILCTRQCPQMYPCPAGEELDSMLRCAPMQCDGGLISADGRSCIIDPGSDVTDDPGTDGNSVAVIVSEGTRHRTPSEAAYEAANQARLWGDDYAEHGTFILRDGRQWGYGDLVQGGFDSLTDEQILDEVSLLEGQGHRLQTYIQVHDEAGTLNDAGEVVLSSGPKDSDYARAKRIFDLTGVRSFFVYTGENRLRRHRVSKPGTRITRGRGTVTSTPSTEPPVQPPVEEPTTPPPVTEEPLPVPNGECPPNTDEECNPLPDYTQH